MTFFQIILLTFAVISAITAIVLLSKQVVGRVVGAAVLLLSVLGAVCTLFPNSATAMAHVLGIGRGADLLLYLLVIGTSVGFLVMYVKLRVFRRELTLLVRKIAVNEVLSIGRNDQPRKS